MEHYEIQNGRLTYEDESLDFDMEMDNLNHSGNGDFAADVFDLVTTTDVEALTVEMEGMTYLRKAKTNLEATLNMNINCLLYTSPSPRD